MTEVDPVGGDRRRFEPSPGGRDGSSSQDGRDIHIATRDRAERAPEARPNVFEARDVAVRYAGVAAVRNIDLDIREREITALIGPSGCGKSTLIRCFNRMNDLVPSATVEGSILYHGQDLYADTVDPVEVRKLIGMVFQKPNPFPKTVFENVAYGLRLRGIRNKADLAERVEKALRGAAIWDEVKDRLQDSALALSGGQMQRLCIARALATQPEILLFDEPTSALDPIATAKIEELISELRQHVTILIVTHNMQQAARVSDFTAFMYLGELVEVGATSMIFTNPGKKATEDYITGRYG